MFAHRLSDDVELRLLEPRHAEELYDLIESNRDRLYQMPFVDYATSVDSELRFTRMALQQFADGRGFECGIWVGGKLSGGIGMSPIDQRNLSTMLGYWLDKRVEGKGIVTAACKAIISHLFNVMGLNRIVIRTTPTNLRSQAVAKRLGFVHEMTQRRAERLHGEFVDVEIFSLTKDDQPDYANEIKDEAFFTYTIDEHTHLGILEPAHAEQLYTLIDNNRGHLRPWMFWVDATKSTDDIETFLKQQLHQQAQNGTPSVGIWHNGNLVGTIGIPRVSAKCAEIGYWIGEEYQGKGLVRNACRAIINHAFNELDANRLEIQAQPENTRSRAIPESLGFTKEGTLRQQRINSDGKFIDLVVYSLLRDEWEGASA